VEQGSPRQQVRLGYIDGLRALAALYVVISHMWLAVWPVLEDKWPTGWELYLTGWMLYSHFAVTIFITISGFCLMIPVVRAGSMLRGGTIRFMLRRALRILLPFYCAMGLALLLIKLFIGHQTGTDWDGAVLTDWNTSLPIYNSALLSNILQLQDVFQRGKINYAFWSIAVEWRIYFLFPVLVMVNRRIGSVALAAIGVVCPWAYFVMLQPLVLRAVPGLMAVAPGVEYGFLGLAPVYIGCFCLGMLGSLIAFTPERWGSAVRNRLPWTAAALVLGVAGSALCWKQGGYQGWTQTILGVQDMIIGAAGACLLVACARPNADRVRSVLAWRPLIFVGTFSFSLYLIHAPLIQMIWQYLLAPLHLGHLAALIALLVVGTPLIIAAAYVFHLLIERPCAVGSAGLSWRR
jgi:peptidoglycan/LPS O-acetylase OafA/YrhL